MLNNLIIFTLLESNCNHQLRYFPRSSWHFTIHTYTKLNCLEVFQSHVKKNNNKKTEIHACMAQNSHQKCCRWSQTGHLLNDCEGSCNLTSDLCVHTTNRLNRRWQNDTNTHSASIWHKTSIRPHMINLEKPNCPCQRRDIQCFSGSTR